MCPNVNRFVDELRYKLSRAFGFSHVSNKQYSELVFWKHEISKYVKWYQGKISSHYGVPSPASNTRVTAYSLKENAILTWTRAHINKYPDLLLVPKDYFQGMRVLDIGCGPVPYACVFTDCEIVGLDQLASEYKDLGFPLEKYPDHLTYLTASAEKIPAKNGSFGAVISVNALDHVDDFSAVAGEIRRVLRSEGILRFEVAYHRATTCEPWSLSDETIMQHFGSLGVKKISQRLATDIFPESFESTDKVVVWANKE